ncbi:unnamed protein product, partial [Discosporangium mesarthrocarpum]
GLTLVEDCAHSCGVKWRGRQLGHHGVVSRLLRASESPFSRTSLSLPAINPLRRLSCWCRSLLLITLTP